MPHAIGGDDNDEDPPWLGFGAIHTNYINLHPLADAALAVWAVIIYIEFQAAAVSFSSRKKAPRQCLLAILTVT